MGGGRGVARSFMDLCGMSVGKLFANLFGEGKFNLLASGFTQSGNTFGNNYFGIFNTGDLDGSFLRNISASYNGQVDGFVDTGLDWFRVGNGNWHINRGNNGDVVGSFLSNFFAVVVSVTTIPMSWLADSDHLDIDDLFKGDLDSFGGGVFGCLVIRVCAHLLGNNLNAFGTDGTGDGVGEVNVNNDFDGQSNGGTLGHNGWGAHFSGFYDIKN